MQIITLGANKSLGLDPQPLTLSRMAWSSSVGSLGLLIPPTNSCSSLMFAKFSTDWYLSGRNLGLYTWGPYHSTGRAGVSNNDYTLQVMGRSQEKTDTRVWKWCRTNLVIAATKSVLRKVFLIFFTPPNQSVEWYEPPAYPWNIQVIRAVHMGQHRLTPGTFAAVSTPNLTHSGDSDCATTTYVGLAFLGLKAMKRQHITP